MHLAGDSAGGAIEMLAKRLVVVLAAFYEEAVLEQRRLRLFLVSASRRGTARPAPDGTERRLVDADVPVGQYAVEDVLAVSNIAITDDKSRKLHAARLRNDGASGAVSRTTTAQNCLPTLEEMLWRGRPGSWLLARNRAHGCSR